MLIGVNVCALFRAALMEHGHSYKDAEQIVAQIAPQVHEADWITDDHGCTWDRGFVPPPRD